MEWLSDAEAAAWASWLPSPAIETLRYMGFYTVLVREGLRVVAINSNIGLVYNFDRCGKRSWHPIARIMCGHRLLKKFPARDPGGQLAWLGTVLKEAHQRRERVWLIGHGMTIRV